MIKTMTGPLRYQFAIITAYHLACVLVLASEVPHDLVRRQADEDASQIVFSNSNPSQNSLNGDPSSDPQKVEIRPSDWRFLELLQVNSSAPQNIIEAENNPDEWHALASTLLHHSFVADQIMQYQLSRLLGDGEAETNSSYVPYYLDQSARLVAGLNDSAPDDLFQSMGMMVVGQPCLTSSNKGHVSALLVALSDVPSPIVQIDQKVTDKDESEDPLNGQKVEVEYLGGVYDNTDELSSLNSSSMSYLMFLLTGRIDKRSISVRVDQDMTVVRNCTDECDITTTEMPTTTPTEPIDPIPEEEVDTIVQVIENIDCLDCNETASGYSQSVIIENSYEMDDFEKALSRLQESESGHCVIEAVYSQGVNSTANATWYYMDQRELVWTEVEEEYERDIHIGHGLVVILPLISNNGSVSYVILAKTYVDEPASPIVQIQQAFIDHSGCGCVDENVNEDETNVTHYVSQHFEHRYNYSDLALDLDSMTDYIKMLEAVPPFERQYIDIIAFNEIEGPDCNETTTTMETTSTVETTTPEETTTTVETTTPEETTTVGTTTTVETTTPSTTAETTMATEPPTTTSEQTEAPTTAAPAPDAETTTKEQTEAPTTAAPDTETTTKAQEQTEAPTTAAPAPDTETTTKAQEQTEAPTTAAPAPDTKTTTKAQEQTTAPVTAAPAPDTETTTKAQEQTEAPAPETTTKAKEQTEAPVTAAPAPVTAAPAPETTTKAKEQTEAPVTAAPAPVTAAPAPETTTKAKEQTEAPATAAPAPETTTQAKEQTEAPVTAAPVPAPETTTKAQVQTEAPVTAAPAPETTTKAKEQTEAPVTAAPVPAPETTTKEQTDAPATAAPAPETTTKAKEQTDSPVTAAPAPAPETTKAPEPVTEATAPVTEAPVEVTTAQFNTSDFTGSVSTYFTIGTSDSNTILISFGVELILKMIQEKTFTFVFILQVRSSGTVTETFSSLASLATSTGVRKETVISRAEVNEEGTDTTTFTSALERQNKTSSGNNTECIYTMEVTLMKVQFTNSLTGKQYPCDLNDQANAQPPYLEIIDKYNNTVIMRYCYLDENVTIHSFGDQMFGYVVTTGDPNIVPDIQVIQKKEEHCCGGVFYGAFRVPLIVPSPDYPQYKPHMRCPFIFRCDEDYDDCVIRLEFENFNLASNDLSRSRRQALNESETNTTTLAPYVPPTGSDFNRTICAGQDVVRVSQCGSISAINSREFCADNPPSQVYTGYKEVLLYFDSNDEKQDQGFVIKFTPKDRRKWIYSDAELEPKCSCAHNLPNQIRKFFRKRNKSKANKAKANNESLRRVRREEREKLKERRKVEKESTIPERRKRKLKNGENKDRNANNPGKKREEDVEGPRRRKKKMKKMEGGDSNKQGQNSGKKGRDKEEKNDEKPRGRKKKRMKVGNKDTENQNKKKKDGGDIEKNGPKRRRKNGGNEEKSKLQKRKRKKIGNTNASKNEGGNERDQKKLTKNRRKNKLQEKKGKRLQKKNKNEDEDMPMTRAFNGRTNRKRQQYPWLVSLIQYERPLVGEKVKGDRSVERLCGGTLLSNRYILTTTSCCTYCKTVWEKKNKKNNKLRKKRAAEGENNEMTNKRKRRKKGGDKKGEVKEEDDTDTEKKEGNKRRRKNKKTNGELENGGKNRDKDEKPKRNGKGKGMKKGDKKNDNKNDDEDENKGKGKGKKKGDKKDNKNDDDENKGKGKGKKKGDKKKDNKNDDDDENKGKGKGKKKGDKKKDNKNDDDDENKGKRRRKKKGNKNNDRDNDSDDENKNKKRRKGKKKGDQKKDPNSDRENAGPRQNKKVRAPLKKDVAAIIGEGSINIKKLGDIKPLKIGGIFIPSDCYEKMGKTELNGEPLYPVECPVLLKLKKKVKFGRFIKPMCLPIFEKIKINKERAASLGYGIRKESKTEPSKIPSEVINMRVLKKCEKKLKMKLDKTMICTKGKKKSGHMCFFDEGSPLLNVKVTGSGYKQHANLYAALAVPSCQLKEKKKGKKKSRDKRDTSESEAKGKRRKLRRKNQETPDTALASKPRKEAQRRGKKIAPRDGPKRRNRLQDAGGDEYNPRKYNMLYIDVWVNIRSYKKWILNVVFNKKKAKACQRPKHFKSVPDIAKKFEIEDPCPY